MGKAVKFEEYKTNQNHEDLDGLKITEKHESGIYALQKDIFTLVQSYFLLESFKKEFGEIKPKDVPILTFCRENIVNLEERIKFRECNLDPSFFNNQLYRFQYLILNELRRQYENSLLINVELTSKEPDFLNLLIVQQKGYVDDKKRLNILSNLDAAANFSDRIQQSESTTEGMSVTLGLYKKFNAVLDLSNNKLIYE